MVNGEHRCGCGQPLPYNRTFMWEGREVCEKCFDMERLVSAQLYQEEFEEWDVRNSRLGMLVLTCYAAAILAIIWLARG